MHTVCVAAVAHRDWIVDNAVTQNSSTNRKCAAMVLRRLIIAGGLVLAGPVLADESIGSAVGVTPQATGTIAGALTVGSQVFRDETVQTGAAGTAELRFLDETRLGIGPRSTVKLDQFVYRGGQQGDEIVLKLTKGAFRFVTGDAPKKAYRIETPVAVIGLRGTVLDINISGNKVDIQLVEGGADVCPNGRGCSAMDRPGETVSVLPDGTVQRGVGGTQFAISCRLVDSGTSQICSRASGETDEPFEVAPDSGGGSNNVNNGGAAPGGAGTPTAPVDPNQNF